MHLQPHLNYDHSTNDVRFYFFLGQCDLQKSVAFVQDSYGHPPLAIIYRWIKEAVAPGNKQYMHNNVLIIRGIDDVRRGHVISNPGLELRDCLLCVIVSHTA